jgi:hypothetical protein
MIRYDLQVPGCCGTCSSAVSNVICCIVCTSVHVVHTAQHDALISKLHGMLRRQMCLGEHSQYAAAGLHYTPLCWSQYAAAGLHYTPSCC